MEFGSCEQQKKQKLEEFQAKLVETIEGFERKLNENGFALVQVQMGPIKKLEIFLKVDGKLLGKANQKGALPMADLGEWVHCHG